MGGGRMLMMTTDPSLKGNVVGANHFEEDCFPTR